MKLTEPIARCEVDSAAVPWYELPVWSAHKAAEKGNSKNILVRTWGGIGDVICSEPTARYMVEQFKDCRITLETNHPELFAHLYLHDVYDTAVERAIADDYLVKETVPSQGPSVLLPQFLSHIHTHCVDFGSLCALKSQLPIPYRQVRLRPPPINEIRIEQLGFELPVWDWGYVAIHAGRHWASKTFPAAWWNELLEQLKRKGRTPVIFGKHDGESQGYVDTHSAGCIDLRDKTTLNESVWLLQNMRVLLCNDSSPLHMAATGNAWIGFVATVKRPEFITHWRGPACEFGWRMKDFGRGGMWDHSSLNPNVTADVNLDLITEGLMDSFLPPPEDLADWAISRKAANDF